MTTQFALDLRHARRKAGFTQEDVGHLMSSHQSVVSDLEQGKLSPSLGQIVELSLIYGKSFESFFAEMMTRSRGQLTTRLSSLPEPAHPAASTFNRPASLARLKRRLANMPDHGRS
ncbi:helix-turn-helix transcriptional regulator [uncultured Litoreibacter sp.]|uniref:helix-turn-helix transcriptional regulator n=1 Tax=uncultured Litoreibacter sp. TaxID=1392394 RepID=UPI002602A0AE|nr:helix-turn-helix transcriptional regulator [uncultured Litoreibacter sp.]